MHEIFFRSPLKYTRIETILNTLVEIERQKSFILIPYFDSSERARHVFLIPPEIVNYILSHEG